MHFRTKDQRQALCNVQTMCQLCILYSRCFHSGWFFSSNQRTHSQARCFNSRRFQYNEDPGKRAEPSFTLFFFPLSPFLPFSSFWKRAALDACGERERKIRRGRGNSYRGGTFRRPIISRNFEENGAAIPSSFFFPREHEQHKGERTAIVSVRGTSRPSLY